MKVDWSKSQRLFLNLRLILLRFLTAGLLILLPACQVGQSAGPVPTSTSPATLLKFYNWADYMPQSVLDRFTTEYGIQVIYLTYNSMEETVAQLRSGRVFDVVVLENSNIRSMTSEGLLAEINYQNVPNFKNISPNFRDLAFDPDNLHSIPFDYGTTGLIVRDDLVNIPINHWADLWNPRLVGKIAARPMAYEIIGISLKSLGYEVNSENRQELEIALEHLLELKSSLKFVHDSTSEAVQVLLRGEAQIMIGWGNDALHAQQENDSITYVLPEEGTLLWGQSFVIPANSPHKYEAELFLNFILRPEISAQIANQNRYATANQEAYPLINPDIFNNPIVFPPAEVIKRSDWYLPLSPTGRQLYANIWARFNSGKP
jgi:spermidine/putrescine transport system substrate-binding protein